MKKPTYLKSIRWSDEDDCYIGSIPDLCGDCCHAETEIDVFKQLVEIEASLIDNYKADGASLPIIRTRLVTEPA